MADPHDVRGSAVSPDARTEARRLIPSIEHLRGRPQARALASSYGQAAVVDALQREAERVRAELLDAARRGEAIDPSSQEETAALIEQRATSRLDATFGSRLRPVLNATGVIIHTNLGRAPLAEGALARMIEVASGYTSLEFDLDMGRRGRRDVHAERLLQHLTGAEAAVVVNNNAAAALLILTALAQGREVIVSRGELVEIGGGFRVPDIMRQSGAILREVGTTNKTRAADYAAAVSDRTALILRVHPSNFTIEGFTARPTIAELAEVARSCGIPVVEDIGSGYLTPSRADRASQLDVVKTAESRPDTDPTPPLTPTDSPGTLDEPTVRSSIEAGIDVVCFSGDKLLGGPQAGVIVGRHLFVGEIRRHPLMRALRADKLTYAALEGTLVEHASGRPERVPVLHTIALSSAAIGIRADALAARLRTAGLHSDVIDGMSAIGGGSAPGTRLPTRLVTLAVDGVSPDALLARLRTLNPPLIARIERDVVVLDLRTIPPEADALIATMLTARL